MGKDHDRDGGARGAGRFLGSLREALAAASREDDSRLFGPSTVAAPTEPSVPALPPPTADLPNSMPPPLPSQEVQASMNEKQPMPSAAEAAKEARGSTPPAASDRQLEADAPPTTRVAKAGPRAAAGSEPAARTTLVRGKQQVARGSFQQDPVVGWLVIVGGPGLGAFRPVFEGNNTLGRSPSQRIPLDFGDDAISSEEQAYVRYDSADRSFLFVPNLAKTNVVSVNDKRPTGAVPLVAMDVITVGRTQLVFVPFCGPDFDWAELTESKKS